jgi:hypothetical protein
MLDEDQETVRYPHPQLSRGNRIVAYSLSFVLAGTGGAAVFLSDNQAGTTALLAFAAIFGIIAIMGTVPLRIRIGDNEIVLTDKLARAVEDGIKEAPAGQAELLTAAVVSALPEAKQDQLSSELTGYVYERAVVEAVRRIVSTLPGQIRIEVQPRIGKYRADMIVYGMDVVGVEIKWLSPVRRLNLATVVQVSHYAEAAKQAGVRIDRWLLITNAQPVRSVQEFLASLVDLKIDILTTAPETLNQDIADYFNSES